MGHDCVRRIGQDAGCARTGAFTAMVGDAGRGPQGRRCGSARPAHGACRLRNSRRQRGDRLRLTDHSRPAHGQFRIRPLHLRLGDDDPARQSLLPGFSHDGHPLPSRVSRSWRERRNPWADLDSTPLFDVGRNRGRRRRADRIALSRRPYRILLRHAAVPGDLRSAHGGAGRRAGRAPAAPTVGQWPRCCRPTS